ncbi:EP400 family protein [Megaselia abdita]
MNEGDSAGGGHHGLNPASPAVTDRRSTQQIAITSLSNSSSTNSTATTRNTQKYNQEILSSSQQQLQQTIIPSGSAVSTTSSSSIPSTTTQQSQTQTTRNILVVTTIQQPMTIKQQTIDSVSSPIISVVNRPSSYNTNTNTTASNVPSTTVVSNPTHSQVKRFKLDVGVPDITALKKRILEHKLARKRIISEKHSENVVELFFLSIGGNMMDYPTWKKKPLPQQFNNYNKAYRLNVLSNSEDQKQISLSQSSLNVTNLPEGAEVKISGVGVTPVAVSKTLPASVVQLTQQGGKPLVPDVPATISATTLTEKSTSIPPTTTLSSNHNVNTTTLSSSIATLSSLNTSGNGSINDVTVKAKQEVYVLQRISELQREGLWTEKRLPKLQEPSRPKAHWDYLLEEMVWLAADFAQERKWKKNAAKKCSRMVQKYFQDKANAAHKAEKAQELHLKRVAAFIAREVKIFWSGVEKIVEYKHTTKLEEKRKKALDQHLNFIVDQTEKFSQQLVEGMNKTVPTADNSAAASLNSSRISSPKRDRASDDEFRPAEDSQDDEETIAKAEEENNSDVKDEIAALQKESEMDLDDFLKELPADYLANRDRLIQQESSAKSDDDEFAADEPSEDDEDTIMEEEKAEGDSVDHKQEIDELNADAEMSIDELIAKYNAKPPPNISSAQSSTSRRRSTRLAPVVTEPPRIQEIDSDDDSNSENDSDNSDDEEEFLTADEESKEESKPNTGLKSLLEDDPEKGDDLLHDAAALAESIQPKGNTLSSTNVVTPVPFLLKHSLREYQHIGLDWLVTMCDRKLNGILADEMGLGKTIQTIALLAHLACEKGNWGPHLIVVPSSVMLNWEMEFKKWCPGFKILTYYGTQKERKLKRVGWTKPNAFHICITSYKLVIQDQQSFRRKKWKYLILDEAQNIKNFKSQRWQLLLNFATEQRLLLTGTPLQNNLMELWSLMHFLMPHVFQSHREFKEWFSNPVTGMIEGNAEYNESIIKRLHKVLRPFLLRRLKSEVEKQMPQKYEHVVMCRLSKRQRYLYDDFMGRAKTKETLNSGSLLSVINVLMQLRKVCNHPNLFETRPTVSPFQMEGLSIKAPSLVCNILQYDPFKHVDLNALNLLLVQIEMTLTAYVSYKSRKLQAHKKLIEEIDNKSVLVPQCPKDDFKFYIRIKDTKTAETMSSHFNCVKIGTSPAMKTEGNKLVPAVNVVESNKNLRLANINPLNKKIIVENDSLVNALAHELKSPVDVKMEIDENLNNVEEPSNVKVYDAEFGFTSYTEQRKTDRLHNLVSQARINRRRCSATPIYGSDCRKSMEGCLNPVRNIDFSTWSSRSFTNCRRAQPRDHNWALEAALKTFEERTADLSDIFDNFVLFVPSVLAPQPYLHVQHLDPSKSNQENYRDKMLRYQLSPKLNLLHPIISQMSTKFPDPRLIQYDCGKLQTLDRLLKNLKDGQHRVLIFTQMTKMLDVLEAFLNYHGHIYLRLDGSTKIDQRQILMERFNGDKRIFVFILSTRSGGVGVNLTGADTVIFYDSDWNPTMDAQAQDRCHRIGQTRDVHIYRLISEKTIEENILKKANQKRMLGDLAIEGGNFTTAFFKSTTIQGLFEVQQENDASTRLAEVVESRNNVPLEKARDEKTSISTFENALAEAEDELDVEAAKVAAAEAAADLDEFDENIPLEETEKPEMSKIDQEMEQIVSQLSPIERYALNFVEATGDAWTAESLRLAEAEIEAQKKEWEANRLASIQKQEEELQKIEQLENEGGDEYESEDDVMLTYSREDAMNQIWISNNSFEEMPLWCPPTPPQHDNDMYIDYSLIFLYEKDIMVESQLPPIYIKRDYKRSRSDAGYGLFDGRKPPKIRKEDSYYAPRSLFDRPSPAIAKMRRELKSQRYRGAFKPNVQVPGLKQQLNQKAITEPEGTPEWGVYEEVTILHCLQNLQGLPLNLMLLSPGHTPNWDLVAETVNLHSKTYRPPVHCRWKFHSHIVPREEGKLTDSPKKQKKLKLSSKPNLKGGLKMLKSSQQFTSDNNASYTKLMKNRFDAIKAAYLQKAPPPKRKFSTPSSMNQKHAEVLCSFGITSYDDPMSPTTIAFRKAEKLREKHHHHHHQPTCSNSSQSLSAQQSNASIVVQQGNSPQVTQILQRSQSTSSNSSGGTPSTNSIQVHHHQTGQIVKAIVAPSQQNQQIQLQQAGGNNNIVPSSVSVVLTTPVSTLSSQGAAQILSLQPQGQTTSSSSSSIVQAIPTTQVVSVSQLTTVGTVLTTSTGLQPTGSVTPLNTSGLRTQRIVTGPGSIQEVVLQQRSNAQSPTIVSMSSLGQTVPVQQQQQFQQFKLTVAGNPLATTSGVVTKGLQQAGKMSTAQPTAQILYRQQPSRNQIKILQAQPGQATALVNSSGAINIVPATSQTMQVQGQKVAVASVSASGQPTQSIVTSVATVQVTPGQARPQFIKQVGTKVGRADNEMLLVKRQVLTTGGQHKQQLIPQATQIFTPTNIQVQQQNQSQNTQVGSSGNNQVNLGQQQIATIVKTTSGNSTNLTGSGGMISQIKPSGQIKVTMGNQAQMRSLQLQQQPLYQRKVGGAVTVQQIQQVIRHAPPGTLQTTGGQIVLGKTRVIPVSLASQPNARQAIQVVSAGPSGQTINAGNLRTHVAGGQNISGTIKVPNPNSNQLQQGQQQNQQSGHNQPQQQRQNSSPVRIQASGGNLVTVAVQQLLPNQNTTGQSVEIQNIQQQAQPTTSQQQTTQQQVRTLVKKKLMQNRYEKKVD